MYPYTITYTNVSKITLFLYQYTKLCANVTKYNFNFASKYKDLYQCKIMATNVFWFEYRFNYSHNILIIPLFLLNCLPLPKRKKNRGKEKKGKKEIPESEFLNFALPLSKAISICDQFLLKDGKHPTPIECPKINYPISWEWGCTFLMIVSC